MTTFEVQLEELMGTGALNQKHHMPFWSQSEKTECLCRLEETSYKGELEQAIANCTLDSIEILISSGQPHESLALHLAATYCALEAIELLVSAGFSCYFKNELGETPLHVCVKMIDSSDGILCVSFLCLAGPKAMTMIDRRGLMPIHVAIEHGRLGMAKTLISHGSSLESETLAGLSLSSFATKNRFDISKLRDDTLVPQSKIHEIWDCFFENAMKMCEKGVLVLANGGTGTLQSTHQSSLHEWFQWILCYGPENNDHGNSYYVIHRDGISASRWLLDHLSIIDRLDLLDRKLHDDCLPETLATAENGGWMIYFDQVANQCFWLNLISGCQEAYLPLAGDPAVEDIDLVVADEWWVSCNITSFICGWVLVVINDNQNDDDGTMKILKAKLNSTKIGSTSTHDFESRSSGDKNLSTILAMPSGQWYYLNRVTGHSSWEIPPGHEASLKLNNNWQLCADMWSNLFW